MKNRFEDSHGLQSVGNDAFSDDIPTVLTVYTFVS